MTDSQAKTDLHTYLRNVRGAVLWKLEGLSEYDVRRPLTPTGTNLLGLVKHLTAVEQGYFGDTFRRPFFDEPLSWARADAELESDMWATADEPREWITGLYREAWGHADATIEALSLDSPGVVPWWPEERRNVTLHRILVHVVAETNRHAGHADIVRELVDGTVGMLEGRDNMPPVDRAWREEHVRRLEEAARKAAGTN